MRVPDCCARLYHALPYIIPATAASAAVTAVYGLFFSTLCTGRNASSDNSGAWSRITGALGSLATSISTIKTPDAMCETGEGIDCCTGRVSFTATVYLTTLTAASLLTYFAVRKFSPIPAAPTTATSPTHSRAQSAPAAVSRVDSTAFIQDLRARAQSESATTFVPGEEGSTDA